MTRTTGDATTDVLVAGPTLDDGDLPTRMLVLGVARSDGTIRAAELFPVAEACARSAEQVRSCLRRLVAEGLFRREGVGQGAVYRATDAGLAVLGAAAERTRLAIAQDRAGAAWDGRWHLAAFAVPEARRGARDELRGRLGRLGGAAVHNGLYVSPHPWEKDVVAAAEHLGVIEHVTLASSEALVVGGVADPAALARRLWPVDVLAARYRAFVDRWGLVPDQLDAMAARHESLPDWAFLPGALAMGLAFADCFEADPLLPPDLLPQPWPGAVARELLVASRVLAMRLRGAQDRRALFQAFDDLVETLNVGEERKTP